MGEEISCVCATTILILLGEYQKHWSRTCPTERSAKASVVTETATRSAAAAKTASTTSTTTPRTCIAAAAFTATTGAAAEPGPTKTTSSKVTSVGRTIIHGRDQLIERRTECNGVAWPPTWIQP